MSIVFIRLDKIGDLIATLPVDQHPDLKPQQITWVVSEGLGVLLQKSDPLRKYIEINNSKDKWKNSFQKLLEFLKNEKPEAVVVFYAPWWVSYACFLAKIPIRAGRRSQWHSYLFFNKGYRQSRSESKMHEAEYNQELVEKTLELKSFPPAALRLCPQSNPHLLEKFLLQKNQYTVIHPGMFGSALNAPPELYNDLIEKLIQKNTVVITGTQQDERFLTEVKTKWNTHTHVRILQNQLSMSELLCILSMSKNVIAPSTGVLHLAAALGKKVAGIYSPILAHHPKRWGPRTSQQKSYVLPNVKCPATSKCLNEKCDFYPCMSKITSDEILEILESE